MNIIIIGAGMAGLSAALELKRKGISYILLEAGQEAGGRAISQRLPSGTIVDLGAHWLHGDKTPLKAVLESYGIPYRKDKAEHVFIYQNGKVTKSNGTEWLDNAVDPKKAQRVEKGEESDCPITDLAIDERSHEILRDFAIMWNGIDPPMKPSAREFLTDESTPGGLQPEGGISALINAMADDVGREHILLNSRVSSITSSSDYVEVRTSDGKAWRADRVIFTGSLAVLKSNAITFDPFLRSDFRKHLDGMVMGKMNKIILELAPDFLRERKMPENMAVELLDTEPPHFCHVRSAGLPLITLFVSGSQAEEIEGLNEEDALHYATRVLAPLEELSGFEAHIVGKPIITRWVTNPYMGGAYASCLPGAKRSGPWTEGRIYICGDSFDKDYPASLAGAYQSGKEAARMVMHD